MTKRERKAIDLHRHNDVGKQEEFEMRFPYRAQRGQEKNRESNACKNSGPNPQLCQSS
jgi:hypothetical protein